ncbi:SUMF1/EgtB/PvdO family nonheme iron enzyme [Microcoleus sp. FACHB-68]|uniref:bifunctional serine/threonine-protein kinase/formylglycine-generating enzyme family protein n=1 Tax=Microcoleus sp. FACHB-68 TaxID=2692826 RepID=UPI0016866EBB|nr:SUMF1/EgtB/PvdO family nonheme iron enzyme [Microcoleus sp. FACHB-68]MBD1940050.1 SUMF1/EgtB/PvdO family nonheme iron enzyme [Microcoleus sp. FACHB-68]
MPYCLNPSCQKPQNPDGTKFCVNCGTKLVPLLRGRYSIISALGQGGFGKTYLAEDEDRRKAICVVKQFSPSPAIQTSAPALQKAIELFHQEAERLLHLEDHPQIPTLFAYFEQDTYLYLVQQFIKGQTLIEELEQQGTFSEAKIRELLNDLLPILQYVHNRPVIHRDIKPENIIRRQSDGKLILIDFGVAKQMSGTSLSQQGTLLGTPGYAPIEQAMRGVAYPASDLYSLAVTCIRLMTGIFPDLDGSDELYDPLEACWLWREKLPRGTTVSAGLGEVLDKLLQDYVKDRYQSATEVLEALNAQPVAPRNLTIPPTSTATTFVQGGRGKVNLQSFNFEVVTVDAWGNPINLQRHHAEYFAESLGGGVILEMVSIPGGAFWMGSPTIEKERDSSESPQHKVNIAPFFMGKYAVTQAQWKAVASLPKVKQYLSPEPSHFKGADAPVEYVTWHDAVEFCARLTKKTGRFYRLPSEAEWEYACRGRTITPFHFGETITPDLANYDGNHTYASGPEGKSRHITTLVETFPPNAFGLYDMHGNVGEWCADPGHENYVGAPVDGSVWDAGGNKQYRMLRGGALTESPGNCRSASRAREEPNSSWKNCGFRVAVSLA